MENNFLDNLIKTYQKRYRSAPTTLISAPGRVNLIGEHTDYSGGFVLPLAIDLKIYIALGERNDQNVELYSIDFDEAINFDLKNFEVHHQEWKAYITAVTKTMVDEGYALKGWQGVVAGSIPIGAGLSSSAAFEVACILAFCQASRLKLPTKTIALMAQKAETTWVGVNVGIMDQLISAAGKAKHAMLLDCDSFDYEYIPFPSGINLIILDTMTRRKLSASEYNKRHEEVNSAAQVIGVSKLRLATMNQINHLHQEGALSQNLYRRAKHIITENNRVLNFAEAMRHEDLDTMGILINQSHQSLRDDFEVSSFELNTIVDAAQSQSNCLGARMIGAGFGGCALALVKNRGLENFIIQVSRTYQEKTHLLPQIYRVNSSDGGKLENIISTANN